MPAAEPLSRDFFARSALDVARDVIGATLLVGGVGGRIVETEAYVREDPASHSYAGPTARNAAMFGPPGHAYVYRSYGIHWCLNFVCDQTQPGCAVLIRALEPTEGLQEMRLRRGMENERLLCAGPGRLCQALGVSREHDSLPLDQVPFGLIAAPERPDLVAGPRIGISKAVDHPWRFGEKGSRYLSRPFRVPAVQVAK